MVPIAPGGLSPEILPETSCIRCCTKPGSLIKPPRPGATTVLKDVYITAAARCAPPDNKPLPQELANCATFLDRELEGLKKLKVVVALGRIGFDAYLNYLKRRGMLIRRVEFLFTHGAKYTTPDGRTLLASYHPSNQNTQTGKLTRSMFLEIFKEAARIADQ
jgi:uracil-DNA glycosylase